MYGADPDNYNIRITNRGMLLNINGGKIEGWQRAWKINALGGINIGDISNVNSPLYTSNIRIGHNAEGASSTTTIYGKLKIANIPTSDPHSSGQIWSNGGSLMVSSG